MNMFRMPFSKKDECCNWLALLGGLSLRELLGGCNYCDGL